MREHIFKAQRLDTKEWIEGCLVIRKDVGNNAINCYIIRPSYVHFNNSHIVHIEVDPETVCEFTCLLDKNGKKIFEGDVVKYEVDRNFYKKAEIVFKDCQFLCIDLSNKMVSQPAYMDYEFEVIGNKFDLEVQDVKD